MYNDRDSEWNSQLVSFFGCFVTLLLSLLLNGCGYQFWMDDTSDLQRSNKIDQFSQSISHWSQSGLERYSQIGAIHAHLETTNGTVVKSNITLIPQHSQRDIPAISGEEGASLDSSYRTLTYKTESAITWHGEWSTEPLSLVLSSQLVSATLPWNFAKEQSFGAVGWKVCNHQKKGAWIKNQCTVYRQLSDFCLQLHWDHNIGKWTFLENYMGCQPPLWEPGKYQIVRTGRNTPVTTLNIEGVDITLVATDDPHQIAVNTTGGSLNFGMSQSERVATALTLFVLGMACLWLFIAICVCQMKDMGYCDERSPTTTSPSTPVTPLQFVTVGKTHHRVHASRNSW
eukprot:TRINITY_DN66663_c7_g3_i1.p1 TRINITY_DN66663_c7_g3~~TRINITY_DN66663_c7_g3_i1.p1  ORF type:complete len:342 (+),score=22.15 TRINITY_DN66663_c7_g3_i1:38-1063(+)